MSSQLNHTKVDDSDESVENIVVQQTNKDNVQKFELDLSEASRRYRRSKPISLKKVKDKRTRTVLQRVRDADKHASEQAALAELLLPTEAGVLETEGELERTFKLKQSQVRDLVHEQSARKIFQLDLRDSAPYRCDYTRNGRYLLLGGRASQGHVAVVDWLKLKAKCDTTVGEPIRDLCFLHTHNYVATAQKKYVHIYDQSGIELHCLKNHIDVNRLQFLPFHFLLCSIGNAGYLKYQDTSTGELVAEHRTKLGPCSTMKQNASNAVVHLGHRNGVVTFWSPNMKDPLVRMFCHRGDVKDIAFDIRGQSMFTCGADATVKVWDLRTFKLRHSTTLKKAATSLDMSQRGMLACGWGPRVYIWKDAVDTAMRAPYMEHLLPGEQVGEVRFAPFDDVLGVAHTGGFTSMVVPGAGEPNYDSYMATPFETKRQRQEREVRNVLEKLQPDMITLDSNVIGTVDRTTIDTLRANEELFDEIKLPQGRIKLKNKSRGRNSSSKRFRRKQTMIIDAKSKEKDGLREQAAKRVKLSQQETTSTTTSSSTSALDRFKKK